MIGLSLAGGGARGSYQIGAYLAFKKCHIKFDGYVGTSIGCFNAAMLAAGRDKELLDFWKNVNVGKIAGFNDNYIHKLQQANKTNNVFIHLIKNAKEVVINHGLPTNGLREILGNLNIEKDLRKSGKDFGLITVRAKDFKPVYIFKNDIPVGKLDDYLIASCYLPVFQMQKIIDESYYLDGGFYDNSPANMLLDKGYKKVYVVELAAVGIKRKVKDKKKVVVIKPSHNLKSILNTNLEDINYNIKLGYYDTIKVIKNLDGKKYIFKKLNPWMYSWMTRNVRKKIRSEMERFFQTFDDKTLVIKALEYVMKKEEYEYTEIYNPIKIIKEIKKSPIKTSVYKFIKELQII